MRGRGHIRRRDKSGKSWELKYDVRENGQRRTQYRSFRGSRAQAQAELARLLVAVDKGDHVNPSKMTVAEYLHSRLKRWRAMGTVSAKPAERYDQLIKNQIEPFIGSKLIQRLTEEQVEEWHAQLLSAGRHDGFGGIATRTVKDIHRILFKALDEALRHKLVPRNVCALQRPPKVVSGEMHILTPEQVAGFAALLDGHEVAAAALTALFTGMRRGEVLSLDWGNVDLDAKLIKVRRSLEETDEGGLQFKPPKTKAGKRDITLPDIVIETLQAHRKRLLERRLQLGLGKLGKDDLVFPDWEGSPQWPDRFSARWSELSRKLKLGVSFHELRHTHASQLIDAGVDVVTISKRLGHASPTITLSTYAHLFRKDDGKAADAINAALEVKRG
jgi:integrase